MAQFSDVLLTVDYDRTLTAPDSTIPERNLEAIRYFMENGGAFTVNTGRSVPMTRAFVGKVPVNAPLLLYNGSAAYDPNTRKFLFTHEIPLNLWDTIHTCQTQFPEMTVEVQGVDAHYRFSENPAWDAFCDHNLCARGYALPGMDLGPFLKFSLYGEIREPTVAGLFDGSKEEIRRIDQVQEQLKTLFGDCCEVFRAAPRILDVHAKGSARPVPPGSCSRSWAGTFWCALAMPRTILPCSRMRILPLCPGTPPWQTASPTCALAAMERLPM